MSETLFSIDTIAFELIGYPISYLELVGTLTGLISVFLAARSNVLTWPVGLVNVSCFFLLFYQVRLYSDMLLQVYFWGMSIWGWIHWRQQNNEGTSVRWLSVGAKWRYAALCVVGTLLLGALMQRIHLWLPAAFPEPAAFPYADAFTTVLSIAATVLLAQRVIETWILWILVDIAAIGIYHLKGIQLISWEYLIFLGIATWGLFNWLNLYAREKGTDHRQISSPAPGTPGAH